MTEVGDRVRRQGKDGAYIHARSQETRLEREYPNGPERYKDYKNIMIGTRKYFDKDLLEKGLVELVSGLLLTVRQRTWTD